MKKLITTFLFIMGFWLAIYPQNAYYDALILGKLDDTITSDGKILFNKKDSIKLCEILKNYASGVKNYNGLVAAFNDNPFIKLPIVLALSSSGMLGDFNKLKPHGGAFSSLGSIDVTNLSQGLSLFLIARAKQELNIAFFDRFKKFTEKYPEIEILFPNTTNSLSNLLAYQYSQMLPVLREAFYKDLNILPDNLVEVMLMDTNDEKMKVFPEFIIALNSITLLKQINQMNPPQVIESLPDIAKDYKCFTKLETLHSALQLTAMFSNAIRTDATHYNDTLKNYWISPTEFYKNILSNTVVLNIFMGLIYQKIQMDSITFNTKPFASSIKKNEKEIWWYKTQLTKLLTQVDKINSAAHSIQLLKTKGTKPTNQDIYSYVETTIDLFEFGYDFASHYNAKLKTQKTDNYIELSRNANSLYINTISQNYALAMNNLIKIISSFNTTYSKKDEKDALKFIESKYPKNSSIRQLSKVNIISDFEKSNESPTTKKIAYTTIQLFDKDTINIDSLVDLIKDEKYIVFPKKILSGITTYGTFIANMADADSPDEIKAAIENAALPAGSSSFKKNYKHNIGLNAYLGVNAGNWSKDNSTSATWNRNFRLTAPIGITYTPFSFGKRGALSVFASLLDVGAIVDYQLSNDGKEVDQKIYLSNIFSPGGYIVYGMAWNLPIAIGFGGQYGPGLVKMGENIWNPSWRWNFFLGVDIPIFSLYKGRGITIKD